MFHPQEDRLMIPVPSDVCRQFGEYVQTRNIPQHQKGAMMKWLRYYWDFCHKYHFPHEHRESLPHFLKKLQEKRQTLAQQEQAAHAIGLYYDLLDAKASRPTPGPSQEGKPTPQPSQEESNSLLKWRPGRKRRPGSVSIWMLESIIS